MPIPIPTAEFSTINLAATSFTPESMAFFKGLSVWMALNSAGETKISKFISLKVCADNALNPTIKVFFSPIHLKYSKFPAALKNEDEVIDPVLSFKYLIYPAKSLEDRVFFFQSSVPIGQMPLLSLLNLERSVSLS